MNSNSIETKNRLTSILANAQGNALDIYYSIIIECFNTDSTPSELLRLVLEFPHRIGTNDGASEKITAQLENKITKEYEELLVNTVELLVDKNKPVDEFYDDLWTAIFCSPTMPESEEARAVILKILNENIPILPYFQVIESVSMTEDDFSERVDNLMPQIREAIHMLSRHFEQKTAESSQLIRISKGLSFEDASAYWGVLFGIIKKIAFDAGKRSALAYADTSDSSEEE